MIPSNPIYHLEVSVIACIVQIYMNGFPLTNVDARQGMKFAPPLNHLLIGSQNIIEFNIFPTLKRDSTLSTLSDLVFESALKVYEQGDIVAPETGEILMKFTLANILEGQSSVDLPLIKKFTFNTDGPEFHNLLINSPALLDEKELTDYAIYIRDLFRAKEIDKIAIEFMPKIKDYSKAYYMDEKNTVEGFKDYVMSEIFPAKPILNFERENIKLTAYCNKCIWKLSVFPDFELLRTTPNSEGEEYIIPIYVANIGGSIRIVR